jgi:glutamine cyclotransferase
MNDRLVHYLNELEWIDGKIWANVYTTDLIVIIDPKSGVVEATVDCSGLLPQSLRDGNTDVLNGIAYDGKHIYLTGKNWKRLYQIELIDKK